MRFGRCSARRKRNYSSANYHRRERLRNERRSTAMQSREEKRAAKNAWLKKRRAAGICTQCGIQCGKGLCENCKVKARPYFKTSNVKRHDARLEWGRTKAQKDKIIVFTHYGNRCMCCGETTFEFLTIDHSERNGSVDPRCHYQGPKKRVRITGGRWYAVIIKLGFPSDLRLLCWNCNHAEHIYKVCPHASKEPSDG
jgi:hypothetical protein